MSVVPLPDHELPEIQEWADFASLLENNANEDGKFLHARGWHVQQTPGLIRGVDIFGPGHFRGIEIANGANISRKIESFLLNDATLMPQSMTILDSDKRLVAVAMQNIPDPRILASYDWHFKLDDNGEIILSPAFYESCSKNDAIALPVCGAGFPNYGHFLYDGLPGVVMHRALLKGDLRIVGQKLSAWQAQILDALDLLPLYVALETPTQFRKVLATSMLSMHVSYPSRFVRPMFDLLRFRLGVKSDGPENVFLSRGTDVSKRVLRNRTEVETTMRRLGFEVICPEQLSFREQVRVMASARVIVGEAGAGFANIGFCDPGATILEILPMVDSWTQSACLQMGHRWRGFFPLIDEGRLKGGSAGVVRFGQDFSFSVDCDELASAIET